MAYPDDSNIQMPLVNQALLDSLHQCIDDHHNHEHRGCYSATHWDNQGRPHMLHYYMSAYGPVITNVVPLARA